MVEYAIRNNSANSRRPILGVISKKQLTKELCQVAFQNDKNLGWSLTHPSYIVLGFILSAALCFEIVYIDIKFGEK